MRQKKGTTMLSKEELAEGCKFAAEARARFHGEVDSAGGIWHTSPELRTWWRWAANHAEELMDEIEASRKRITELEAQTKGHEQRWRHAQETVFEIRQKLKALDMILNRLYELEDGGGKCL